ncbi:MAG: YdcF family protein [Proteobacteria bacterium]|nr:YdcF family protein [Pseudomonadota bacterium]
MIYLHKILPFFVSPLGIIILLLIISLFSKKRFFTFVALLVLLVSSNPMVGNYLINKLEYPYQPIPISSIKENDAIVVLSGMIDKVGNSKYSTYEFKDPDRFFAGIDLIKQQKSDKLIFTAGQLPWTDNWKSEGYVLKNKAISLGVSGKILVSDKVKNTYEESVAVTKMITNNSSIILVTSAYHMQRSKYLFEKQGFEVTPFPVDFKYLDQKLSIISFLPDLKALTKTSLFIRENLGRLYYKVFYS